MTGRGKGNLPLEANLFSVNSLSLHVSCVKQAEDRSGLIIRIFNPLATEEKVELTFGSNIHGAKLTRMDETEIEDLNVAQRKLKFTMGSKKIITIKVILED